MTALVRLRLDIGYDGSDFAGWARQPNQRTVQGVIEEALGRVMRLDPPPVLTVAGRTDAGVHARGQVAHVVVPVAAYYPVTGTLPRRLAGVLPADVRIWRIGQAPEGFDARFSALSRRYASDWAPTTRSPIVARPKSPRHRWSKRWSAPRRASR